MKLPSFMNAFQIKYWILDVHMTKHEKTKHDMTKQNMTKQNKT